MKTSSKLYPCIWCFILLGIIVAGFFIIDSHYYVKVCWDLSDYIPSSNFSTFCYSMLESCCLTAKE